MKNLLIVIAILFLSNVSFSQSWESIYPKPTNKSISAVSILDNGDLIMGCDDSEIFRSTDDGSTWNMLYNDKGYHIESMHFVNDNTWFIFSRNLSSSYKFFKTTDGGITFQHLSSIISQHSYFLNAQTGWIIRTIDGQRVLQKTIDGGYNWSSKSNFQSDLIINDIKFENELTGYIAGYKTVNNGNRILKTIDGGNTWNEILFPTISHYNYFTNIIVFGKNIYVNASGIFVRSSNSGQSWQTIEIQNTMDSKMAFQDSQNGIMIFPSTDNQTIMYKTLNGGLNWSQSIININYSHFLNNFSYHGGKVFTGHSFGFYNLSIDDGENWRTNKIFPNPVHKIYALNENNIYLISGDPNYIIYKSTDLGNSWYKPDNFLDGRNIKSVHFFNENHIAILKSDSVYKTYDNGLNWVGKKLPIQSCYWVYDDMKVLTDKTFMITGSASCPGFQGYSIRYTSYDTLNTFQSTPIAPDGRFVSFINANTGFSFSNTFRCSKTTDRGKSWQQFGEPNITSLIDFFIFNDEKIWGKTNFGISKTSDFANWSLIQNFNTGYSKLLVKDQSNVFVVISLNEDKRIYKTSDRGLTWNSEPFESAHDFLYPSSKIEFVNQNTGFLYSGFRIIKTTNGGMTTTISNTSSEVPSDFILHQNYPNPFNPVTNIKFSIPKSSLVSLKVFDITGREVATLVNENLNAGVYEYRFSADEYNLSSGVYFYRMSAGEFMDSKKLLLIK